MVQLFLRKMAMLHYFQAMRARNVILMQSLPSVLY